MNRRRWYVLSMMVALAVVAMLVVACEGKETLSEFCSLFVIAPLLGLLLWFAPEEADL